MWIGGGRGGRRLRGLEGEVAAVEEESSSRPPAEDEVACWGGGRITLANSRTRRFVPLTFNVVPTTINKSGL